MGLLEAVAAAEPRRKFLSPRLARRAASREGIPHDERGEVSLIMQPAALALLEAAGKAGVAVGEAAVRQGLQSVMWEGRLELIEEYPRVLLDGAHNPAAASALARYLQDFLVRHPASRIILVWGMMRDKDHRGFFAPLQSVVSEIVLTQASLARSATVQELRASLAEWCRPILEASLPSEALMVAKTRATSSDLICVAGSIMLLGDIKASVRGCGLSPIRG